MIPQENAMEPDDLTPEQRLTPLEQRLEKELEEIKQQSEKKREEIHQRFEKELEEIHQRYEKELKWTDSVWWEFIRSVLFGLMMAVGFVLALRIVVELVRWFWSHPMSQ